MNAPELPGFVIGDCLDVLRTLPDGWANCCVTSPPYWRLRDYGHDGQLGLEETPEAYVDRMVEVFREVRRVLRDDGTLWLNIGDSYASDFKGSGGTGKSSLHGSRAKQDEYVERSSTTPRVSRHGLKAKDLVGIPWRLAFALQADGWYLRSDIIWHKPNPMPESVMDRPTKAHEYVFLLSKSRRYYYDAEAIKERVTGNAHSRGSGVNPKARANAAGSKQNESYNTAMTGLVTSRNKRTVWTVPTAPYGGAHFACYPPALIKPCITAGCPDGGIVLDPFFGSGTTGRVAEDLGRRWFGIELNPDYAPLIRERTAQKGLF